MSSNYTGRVITKANTIEPTFPYEISKANGIWSLDEVVQLKRENRWPSRGVPANYFGFGSISTTNQDVIFSAAVSDDANSTVFICGQSRSSANSTADGMPMVIAVQNGTVLWQKHLDAFTSSAGGSFNDIALDSSKNVYVCGTGSYRNDSGGAWTGGSVAIVQKLDRLTGNTILKAGYTANEGTTGVTSFTSMVIDTNNNIYCLGSDVNTYKLNIFKFDTNLNLSWQRRYNGDINNRFAALNIDADSTGNVYVSSTWTRVGTGLPSLPLMGKINSSGTLLWTKVWDVPNTSPTPTQLSVVVGSDDVPVGVITGGGNAIIYKANSTTGNVTLQQNLRSTSIDTVKDNTDSSGNYFVYTGSGYASTQTFPGRAIATVNSNLNIVRTVSVNVISSAEASQSATKYNAVLGDRFAAVGRLSQTSSTGFFYTIPRDATRTGANTYAARSTNYTVVYQEESPTLTTFNSAMTSCTSFSITLEDGGNVSNTANIPNTSNLLSTGNYGMLCNVYIS